MKIIILTLIFGLLGHAAAKPLESSNDATDVLVEIEKQRLIKFPEELDELRIEGQSPAKSSEAKRILEEIEKINQALGYVKKSDHARVPAILDSSQYLFPNTGYQPFHAQNPQIKGSHGETLLLPSIRSVKFDEGYHHKASEFNKPPVKKVLKPKITTVKPATNNPSMYFHPHRVEVPAPQSPEEKKLLPTHFVIPVRLYKHNKQQFMEKHAPQEYKVKGYKIVGDIDHFYGKTRNNKTTSATKTKSSPKYHLLFLPQEVIAKSAATDIEALGGTNSSETSSREEKLANRPLKVQTNTHATTNGNIVNATSSATIVRKRLRPQKVEGSSVLAVTSSSVIKVTPAPTTGGHTQQQQQQQQTQLQQPQLQHQQQQYQKPSNPRPNNHPVPVGKPTFLTNPANQQPTAVGSNDNHSNNNNNENSNIYNSNNNSNKNRNPFINPLLGIQSNIQNNINNINNATSNAIKTAFQNIFRLPFRPDNNKPQATATEYPTYLQPTALQLSQKQQQQLQQQQQYYYTLVSNPAANVNGNVNVKPPIFMADSMDNDHLDSDYKWDDESASTDSDNSEDKDPIVSYESQEPPEEKIFGHPIREIQQTQKEALKQGGIIIQKLKVRKGGIAIAGPGGVATAGSGGTAIVGPGGYALTHPRSLTIAGPGTKIIAIPSNVDLRDALSRTNIKTKMIPREGRIVATGPTVYYAPGTIDGVEIEDYWQSSAITTWPLQPAPLTAYTTRGLNLLTTGQLEYLKAATRTKQQQEQSANDASIQQRAAPSVATNLPQLLQPQLLTPQPYFVLNNPFYANPFTQFAYTTGHQFLPQFVQSVPTTTNTVARAATATTTRKPKVKDTEPTTKRPKITLKSKPPKLQLNTEAGDFRNDAPLLQAVRQINSEFVIEEIMPVPGHHIFSSINREKVSGDQQKAQGSKALAKKQTSKLSAKKASMNSRVKVEATGRTATSGNIPQIPFDAYFLPYFSQGQQQGVKTASLILEPHSKAIVGNGGTAISAPISRAYLKRGVATNVYFNPESVAIAGVGGKAHAQADLELDLID